ncbi:hypothetical protein [Arthrobacter sp. NPDC058127]|uniref:hypothetical protein n=1 Tax=Arthrobacter sp. NPDC058127 TaxID=3346351 RepID=UPI0036F06B02
MELHEQVSLAIAAADLRYVTGSGLTAGFHPRSWPLLQWGAMVAYEAQKNIRDVHNIELEFDWEEDVTAAARHGGKFFDGRPGQLDSVVADFQKLIDATHLAFYPDDRSGREFDVLRDDLSVISDGSELLLTNVTGHFMAGLPPHRGMDMNSWGPHLQTLATGIGQLASALVSASAENFSQHGNHTNTAVAWWDGKISEAIPATFAGELTTELALGVISIYSTVQAARRWANVECCGSCDAASLKHRFVVLHHAARSIEQLYTRVEGLPPIAVDHVSSLAESADLKTVTAQPFRRLRNGWLHLGLGDIATDLPARPNVLSPVLAYTQMEIPAFAALLDRSLDQVAEGIGCWLAEPGPDGSALFDHLSPPPDEKPSAAADFAEISFRYETILCGANACKGYLGAHRNCAYVEKVGTQLVAQSVPLSRKSSSTVTISAILAAMTAIESSAVSNPFREPSIGLTDRSSS